MNNNKIRNILLGAGAAVAVTAIVAYLASDEVQEKTDATFNRLRAKHFVRNSLNGNDKAIQAIDNMDDEDINSLLETADKFDNLKSQFSSYGDRASDKAQLAMHDVKDRTKEMLN